MTQAHACSIRAASLGSCGKATRCSCLPLLAKQADMIAHSPQAARFFLTLAELLLRVQPIILRGFCVDKATSVIFLHELGPRGLGL